MKIKQSCVFGSVIIVILLLNIAYDIYFAVNENEPCSSVDFEINQIDLNKNEEYQKSLPTETVRNKTLIIFAAVFTGKSDPQRVHIPQNYINCFTYFKEWYVSIHNQSLEAIIFHDGLSEEFMAKYTTENVKFHLVPDEVLHPNLFPAEWRFLAYYDFVRNSPKKWDYVMATDISDVVYNKNPLDFMLQYPEKDLFLSFEESPGRSWVSDKWPKCFDNYDGFKQDLQINAAGMWGGKWSTAYTHLHLLRETLLSIAKCKLSPGICDMLSHVRVTSEYWYGDPEIRSRVWDKGQPLFNKIQTNKGAPGEEPEALAQYYVVHAHRTIKCPDPKE